MEPLGRRAAPWRLAYEQVVTEDEPHPPTELVIIAGRLRATSLSPAVPPTCPKHRSAAVNHGQPQSVRAPAELQDQPVRSGPRELPKLAVLQ